ncbi:MAG: TraR/DksA family transcriptional regulator [Chitinophagaceae bacterium]|nr:TraR/DksA family transcriptional regulator [Chitinophagaceae bacterium]
MATKKKIRPVGGKKAPKKAAKPAPKKNTAKSARPSGGKPAVKKTVKKSTSKPVTKKPVVKPARAASGKVVPKPAAKKPVAKKVAKPAAKPAVKKAAKPVAKPVVKPAAKAPVKPVAKPATKAEQPASLPVPVVKKPGGVDPKSLVSIKPKAAAITKKEPPRPTKVIMPKISTRSSVKYEPEFTKSVLDASIQYQPATPTQRYSDVDLSEFREIIMKKLDAAKKELNYLQGLITRKDEGGDMDEARYMTMEDGSVSMEREQLSQMASRQITFIDHLEKALMRIENKTYGICRVTGKLIDKARLKAVPHATLSIEAKQLMNK